MTCSHPKIHRGGHRRSLALGLSLLAACTGRSPGDDATDSGASTQSPADTGASTGSSSGDTTSGQAPTSGLETTASQAPETTTDGEATGTGAVMTTGAAETSTGAAETSTGAAETSTGAAETSTGGGDGALVLDPASLVVFDLPINSIRYAIAGFDPAQQTCAAIIFYYPDDAKHCDDFAIGENPYVVITPNAAPPCMDWDYGGNVTVEGASGCVQFTSFNPPAAEIDMVLEVSGAPFTGQIFVGP